MITTSDLELCLKLSKVIPFQTEKNNLLFPSEMITKDTVGILGENREDCSMQNDF